MKMNKSLGFVLGLCAVVSIALVSFKFADKPFGGLVAIGLSFSLVFQGKPLSHQSSALYQHLLKLQRILFSLL